MGKGSYDGINLTPLDFSVLRLVLNRYERVDKLKSLGYEVCKIDGQWFYRQSGSDRLWTPMDNKKQGN